MVTAALLSEALAKHPQCRCVETHGLRPGLTLKQVNSLGPGCHHLWVCPGLDKLRRLLGH